MAADPETAGTAAPELAAAIRRMSGGALAAVEISGPWSADTVTAVLEIAGPAAVLIANLRTGALWGSRPDPAVVLDHLAGGDPDPPAADWDVGHFVELATLVRGPAGALVVVRDTYQELGFAGHHVQPPERVAAALRRGDGREGGVIAGCGGEAAAGLGDRLRGAGLELGGWDNGTPAATAQR
jgi:hypothetical protein